MRPSAVVCDLLAAKRASLRSEAVTPKATQPVTAAADATRSATAVLLILRRGFEELAEVLAAAGTAGSPVTGGVLGAGDSGMIFSKE
ncbi:hypothetical protein GCM10027057_03630 [Marisediminicola antarctica]